MDQFHDLTARGAAALRLAILTASELGHSYVGSEHLLAGLLREGTGQAFHILNGMGLSEKTVRQLLIKIIGKSTATKLDSTDLTPCACRIIEVASSQARLLGYRQAGTEHLLMAVIRESDGYALQLLQRLGVDPQEIYRKCSEVVLANHPGEVEQDPTRKTKNKNSGTPMLDQFSRDLTESARQNRLDPVIGREREIERVIRILSRKTKNNPCLIGDPGVGKTAVVEGLAQWIIAKRVPAELCGKRLIAIDLASMIAGTKYRGDFEDRVKSCLREAERAKNILLFIDELHTIVGAGAAEGGIDAANILKPLLARGEIQLIGATTITEYRKHIEKDAALERRFQSVSVAEPSCAEAIRILEGLRPRYEEYHGVAILPQAMKAAVELSIRYLNDRFLPDKAIDLLDEAAVRVKLRIGKVTEQLTSFENERSVKQKQKELAIQLRNFERAGELREQICRIEQHIKQLQIEQSSQLEPFASGKPEVQQKDIAQIVSELVGIDTEQLTQSEATRFLQLEERLHESIIGQDQAVRAVAHAIRRSRVGLRDPKRPVGSFLFLGTTGVGKTQLCKVLTAQLFGSEDAMVRLDLSEYMEPHSAAKLIGAPPGYVGFEEAGQLTEKIRRRPYSVLLLDEIEKAHPSVLHLLLQILEDGILTDAQGRRVNFRNTIIVMTSNIGSKELCQHARLGFGILEDAEKTTQKEIMAQLKKAFQPEFLNRIDEVVVFQCLKKPEIEQIAQKMLAELARRCETIGVKVAFSKDVVVQIAKLGYDPDYGARPLRRVIQTQIEDLLVLELLNGTITAGTQVLCGWEETDAGGRFVLTIPTGILAAQEEKMQIPNAETLKPA